MKDGLTYKDRYLPLPLHEFIDDDEIHAIASAFSVAPELVILLARSYTAHGATGLNIIYKQGGEKVDFERVEFSHTGEDGTNFETRTVSQVNIGTVIRNALRAFHKDHTHRA